MTKSSIDGAEIREGLDAIREAVVVPPLDLDTLRHRVRGARRRHRVIRSVAAAGVVAAVVTAGAAVVVATSSTQDPTAARAVDPGPDPLPVVQDGRVELLQADGSLEDTGLSGSPVGWYDDRLVVLDGTRLVGVGDHDVTGVSAAFADPAGVTFQLTGGQVERIDHDGRHELLGSGRLLGAGEDAYVLAADDGVVVYGPEGPRSAGRGSDDSTTTATSAAVAGDTVVVVADGSEQFLDSDGTRRFGLFGGEVGALSPDGSTWAYAADRHERKEGMRGGLFFEATDSDREQSAPLHGAARGLVWSDGDVYVVTQAAGKQTLWQCRPTRCDARYTTEDPTFALR